MVRLYVAISCHMYKVGMAQDLALQLKLLSHQGYQRLFSLSYPLPMGVAAYVLNKVATEEEQGGCPLPKSPKGLFRLMGRSSNSLEGRLLSDVKRHLAALDYPNHYHIEELELSQCHNIVLPEAWEMDSVGRILNGKVLFLDEVRRRYSKLPRMRASCEEILQVLVNSGECNMKPGITICGAGHLFCNRCGETRRFYEYDCPICGSPHCYRCAKCDSMGESRLCSSLYYMEPPRNPVRTFEPVKKELSFHLTPGQLRASQGAKDFLKGSRDECLIWAVCGAGKTEVAFSAIEEGLNKGWRVLFAVPRRDVVKELAPRISRAFPKVRVGALYGGAQERDESAQVIVATTHQCIRYFHAFDLVILDEADAYPYSGSRMLYFALTRAKRPGGKVIYMTATPGHELMARVQGEQVRLITIPARHHGYPLPVPTILEEKLTHHGEYRIPDKVMDFLVDSLSQNVQVFIFVPTIEKAEEMGKCLQRALDNTPLKPEGKWLEYSHSQDPKRAYKCQGFSEGQFPIFVTTTIMERGITVPRADVIVLFAHENFIFDEGSLIQMAGRSGRSVEYPNGKVLFVGEERTHEMERAIELIEGMNIEARRLGYIKA